MEFDRISRLDLVLKSYLVLPCIKGLFALDEIRHHHATGLSHHFTLDHARHHRHPREMALQEKFITAHGIAADRRAILLTLCLVNQEHRFPMRQDLLEFFSIHTYTSFSF